MTIEFFTENTILKERDKFTFDSIVEKVASEYRGVPSSSVRSLVREIMKIINCALLISVILFLSSCTEYYRESKEYSVELRYTGMEHYEFEYIDLSNPEGNIIKTRPFIRIKFTEGSIYYVKDSVNEHAVSEEEYFLFMEEYLGFTVKEY